MERAKRIKTPGQQLLGELGTQVKVYRMGVIACGLGSGLFLIIQAMLLAHIVYGSFIQGISRHVLWPSFVTFVVLMGVRALLAWLKEVLGFKVSASIKTTLRQRLFKHMSQDVHASHHSGHVSSLLIEQVEAVEGYFARYLPQMTIAVIFPLMVLCMVFPLNWLSGLILLLTAPLIPLFMALVGMGAKKLNEEHFEALSRLSSSFLDTLQGLRTLKLFGRSKAHAGYVKRRSESYRITTMRVLKIAFLSSSVLEFFASIAIALLATTIGLTFLGKIGVGLTSLPFTLSAGLFILVMAPEFYLPLRDLGSYYHDKAQALGAAKHMADYLASSADLKADEAEGKDSEHAMGCSILTSPIEIKMLGVTYTYPEREAPAIADVTLSFKPGLCALVGQSGAGKSTITKLLLGVIQPDRGRVEVNGQLLSELNLDHWLTHISWVGQQPKLMYGTIYDNIAVAKAGASQAEVKDAATRAHVMEFADLLPQGLQTPIKERNHGLSGGQIQRIAMARALLKDAPFVILDEPIASLDAANRALIMPLIQEMAQHKTVLMITHQLEYLTEVDHRVTIDAGRIVDTALSSIDTDAEVLS